jgi:hypothetical protein
LAQQHPASLVVLVASDRSILQRIYDIQTPNLTAIPGSTLLNWSRTGQRPVAISQKLQQMKAAGTFHPAPVITTTKSNVKPPTTTARVKPPPPPKRSPPAPHRRPTSRPMVSNPVDMGQLFTGLSAFAALAIAGVLIWLIFFSEGFRQFREQSSPPDAVGSTSQTTTP